MEFTIRITINDDASQFTATVVDYPDISATGATEAAAEAALQAKLVTLIAANYFDYPKQKVIIAN